MMQVVCSKQSKGTIMWARYMSIARNAGASGNDLQAIARASTALQTDTHNLLGNP